MSASYPAVGVYASEAGVFTPGRHVEKRFFAVLGAAPPATSSAVESSLGPEKERAFPASEVASLSRPESGPDRPATDDASFRVAEEAGRETESSVGRRGRRSSGEVVTVEQTSREPENVRFASKQ